MRDVDAPRAGVRPRAVTTMAARAAVAPWAGPLVTVTVAVQPRGRMRVDAGAGEHVARLLRRRAEEQLTQFRERRALLLDQVRHVAQGVNRRLQRRVLVLGERRVPRPFDHALQIRHVQIDSRDRRCHLSPQRGVRGRPA